MEEKLIEFDVETRGHCFLCLIKLEPESGPFPVALSWSLDILSRYLAVDRKKVFEQKAPIPPHLLVKVEQSILKAKLCDICGSLNEQVSNLLSCQPPNWDDRVQVKVVVLLTRIHDMIRNSNDTGLTEKFTQSIERIHSVDELGNWMSKLDIVEALRKDFQQKCVLKLRGFHPQVEIPLLSITDIIEEKLKLAMAAYKPGPLTIMEREQELIDLFETRGDRFTCGVCYHKCGSLDMKMLHFGKEHVSWYRRNSCPKPGCTYRNYGRVAKLERHVKMGRCQ